MFPNTQLDVNCNMLEYLVLKCQNTKTYILLRVCEIKVTRETVIQSIDLMKFSKVYNLYCKYEYSCFAVQIYCECAGAFQMSNVLKKEKNLIIGLFESQPQRSRLNNFGFINEQISLPLKSRTLTDVCEEVYMQSMERFIALILVLSKIYFYSVVFQIFISKYYLYSYTNWIGGKNQFCCLTDDYLI